MEHGKVKYGVDKKLEAEANKLLRESVGENKRGVDRDVEKMRYEAGDISEEELCHYDPDNDWETQDSAFTLLVNPPPGERGDLDWVEPTVCADVDDGNVRARNPKAVDRKKLTHIVKDDEDWGPASENIPLLGINEGPRKKCARCKKAKGLMLFSPDERNRDGLRSWCKECERVSSKDRYTRKSK